jgi:hypothetical protein
MKILDDVWFASFQFGAIGIVIGEDDVTGECKAYVGAGEGVSREDDIQSISTYGAKLTPEIAAKIASLLNPPALETVKHPRPAPIEDHATITKR